jgi:hypothetical protein
VEQEGPFFDILPFFPILTKELLEENRAWMQPKYMSSQDQIVLCSELLGANAAAQHPD